MKKSIFSKVFGGYILLIVLLSVCILAFSFRTIREHYISTATESLKNLAITLSINIKAYLEDDRFKELDDFVKELGAQINTRITIIDPTGVVIADSEKDPSLMENHRNRPEVSQALKGGVGEFLRYSTTVKEDMLYVALPLGKDEGTVGVLRISLFLKDINSLLNNLKANIVRIVFLIVAVSLLAALIFTRSLTKPIKELSVAFRRVASGDFDAKVFLKRRDEVKELADTFNVMTDKMKTLFAELSRQKESLNNIVSSVQEGLVVLSKEEKVKLSNDSFKKIVKNDSVDEKFYWEIIREAKFGELVKKVREKEKNLTEEVGLDGRVYLCSATFMKAQEEIVIILHDITTIKNIEQIKKDFVVNVSHELRTPLTAIKGFAETLEEEVDEKGRQYVEVIQRNTDRLIYIIQDLLLLAEIEERGATFSLENVDAKKVAENVIRIFKQKVEEKNLHLNLVAEDGLPQIRADAFKLEQLFINLVDNSIKYTETGDITVSINKTEESLAIEVEDTGIGISQEHQSRVFERFYVVDKSRSKKLGGTGLGLSIVKHIALLHNGKIDVESAPGRGTKFVISLPISPA
jgi:two-component system phosphate regulon sensor histidine kinase PhoR